MIEPTDAATADAAARAATAAPAAAVAAGAGGGGGGGAAPTGAAAAGGAHAQGAAAAGSGAAGGGAAGAPAVAAAPSWTKVETDHLFDIIGRFDVRWPVVLDRYALSPPRPLEVLKQRYYDVTRRLLRARLLQPDPAVAASLAGLSSEHKDFSYDAARDAKRRRALEGPWVRPRSAVNEEVRARAPPPPSAPCVWHQRWVCGAGGPAYRGQADRGGDSDVREECAQGSHPSRSRGGARGGCTWGELRRARRPRGRRRRRRRLAAAAATGARLRQRRRFAETRCGTRCVRRGAPPPHPVGSSLCARPAFSLI